MNVGYAATDSVYGHLPVVDIWRDPNIWAIPDGDCMCRRNWRKWAEDMRAYIMRTREQNHFLDLDRRNLHAKAHLDFRQRTEHGIHAQKDGK